MIAAMANYLKFDLYNLDLTLFSSDSELMSALRETFSRSLIVVEDIDCNKLSGP
jgi:chaperone BCS1